MAIQIDAVEESFEIVAPHDAKLMDAFYSGLCELAPEVSPLFAGADMAVQKQKLLSTLLLLVDSLRDLDAIVPALHDLGAKHVTHGVEPQHHALVGSAPPGALEEVSGEGWKPACGAAWTDAFAVVVQTMKAGALVEK
ncbi:MAG TPA: globin domain-containing protein [Candidatus Dormibacteraeota bacterium]|nr:globin domain-containing protein [Candidatus Dormibacteraeota bacterium]